MERRLNFEGMVSHLFLKAKQPNDQIGKNTMPTLHKNCKKKIIYWPYLAFRWNRVMIGATVSIKVLSSEWFSLLINT